MGVLVVEVKHGGESERIRYFPLRLSAAIPTGNAAVRMPKKVARLADFVPERAEDA